MRHEQYTCDRCHGKVDGVPSAQGDWYFRIGELHPCKLRMTAGNNDLCQECLDQVVSATMALWRALWPKMVVTK